MEFCHSYLFVTFVVMTVDEIAHDAKLVFSLLTLARYRDLSDLLRSPIVSHVPPQMSFIA